MEDFETSGSESDYASSWVGWFLGCKGNEYFCEIDEEYITDRFNLTYLNSEVQHYNEALELITDGFDQNVDADIRDLVEKAGSHLYGLLHARYILTSRGLQKMRDKYVNAHFGQCHRVLCRLQNLLPVGLSDGPHTSPVKLYCPRCEDIYVPKSSRHASIDGAYFGTGFPHIFLQCYPNLIPQKTEERYSPKLFGLKIREYAEIHRWQDKSREKVKVHVENSESEKDEETVVS